MVIPSLVRKAVDIMATGGTKEKVLPVVAAIVGLAFVSGLFLFLQRLLLIGLSRHLEHQLRTETFDHLLHLPASWFSQQRVGDLLTRLGSDVGAVRMAAGPALMYLASTATVLVSALWLMFRIHVGLTLAALALAPLVAAATKFFGSRIYRRWGNAQEELSRFTGRLQEHLAGLRVLRAFACEKSEKATLAGLNRQYFLAARSLINVQSLFFPFLQFLVGLGFVVVLGFGGYLVTVQRVSLGQFVEFNLYLARLIWPMIAVGVVANLWQRGAASLRRLEELLGQKREMVTIQEPQKRAPRGGLALSFVELTFSYPGAMTPALQELSFTVPAGRRVAILGEVGSGKSTLLQMVPRLLIPPAGTVYLDGKDVLDWNLQELRATVTLVPQTAFLFSATLRENIAMGKPQANDEEVWAAAVAAGLLPELEAWPEGLDTVVGERGLTLSGGQRQRVALARALLLKPAVLLLDDCLSAVDRRTEEAILNALPNTTLLFATHRLRAALTAHWVVVLENGQIATQGPPELLSQGHHIWAQLLALEAAEEEARSA